MENKKFTWNGIDLNELRKVMDKPSDDAVSSVFESGKKMEHFVDDLKKMASNHDYVPTEIPGPMHDFVQKELAFEFTNEDIGYFKQTHKIWEKQGMKFIFILFFRALPYTYMAEKPANVLRMTKLLKTHTERRIFETAQFVFDVMDENWWTPEKRGVLTALKVRIMHSAMRHVILQAKSNSNETDIVTGVWESKWGKPICQEDLVATNQVFSLEFFKGLEMLGHGLTPEEQKAWFHTWKIIGKIMGVQDELISTDVEEAWTLQHAIYDHLFNDETEAGIPLAAALVETMKNFHLPEKLILIMMKRMLADEQFPDCFERMLGPSYKKDHPELFTTFKTPEEKEENDKLLKGHFHQHMNGFYHILKEVRPNYPTSESKSSWWEKILFLLLTLFGGGKNKLHLIDLNVDKLHNLLHKNGTDDPVDEIQEDVILEFMSALGGIMVGILSFHFRLGKNSGFRIPKTLKDNWSLK